MIDLALVHGRMLALEDETPEEDTPIVAVLAKLVGIDPVTAGLAQRLVAEVARARDLANGYYRNVAGHTLAVDDPTVIGAIAFLQGVTFARAVRDIQGDRLGTYLDDGILLWRRKAAEAGSEDDELIARCYVDAFQSVRVSMLGEPLP